MKFSMIAGVVAMAAGAASAQFTVTAAGPINSDGPFGNAGNGSFSAIYGGPSTIFSSLRLRGTLNNGGVGTFASEARWNITNTAFGTGINYQALTTGSFTAPIAADATFNILQWANAGDSFRFEAFESFNDGGLDATWTNLQFDFAAASITNVGTYAPGDLSFDTFGSSYDTELALYTASGTLLANNDDALGLQSQINATGLGDGVYYLVLGGFDTLFGNGLAVGGLGAGSFNLSIGGTSVASGTAAARELRVFAFTIPTPGVAGVLAASALVAGRRRRA